MWTPAAEAAKQDPQSNTLQLFVESLNDVISAQGRRDAARLNHLPGSALYLLFAVSALSLGVLGYRAGLGRGRSLLGTVLLVLLIGTLLVVILDIDHPYQGLITISQQSLIDLRRFMNVGSGTPRELSISMRVYMRAADPLVMLAQPPNPLKGEPPARRFAATPAPLP